MRGQAPEYLSDLHEHSETWTAWPPYAQVGDALLWLLLPLCLLAAALFIAWERRGATPRSSSGGPLVARLMCISLAATCAAAVFALWERPTVAGPLFLVTTEAVDHYLLMLAVLTGLVAISALLAALVVRRIRTQLRAAPAQL